MNLVTSFKSLLFKCYIKVHERTYGTKLKYLYLPKRSNSLLIVFSGFSPDGERRYNYIRSLDKLKISKLFVLDPYAYKGSYHLFENGNDYPQKETQGLIDKFKSKYKYIFMAGSSKGGTVALYYGLLNEADAVFSGACQYNLGTYLSRKEHIKIFKSMMGELNQNTINTLENIVKNVILSKEGTKTRVYLLYSKQEPTYEEEIIDLVKDLKDHHYNLIEKIESFDNHGAVGSFFPSFVIENLKIFE